MRKAVKTNLGGIIFHLDEDAFDKLQSYLQSIGNQFGNNAEAKEIVADIESRIAELFQSRINELKQVINSEDVDEVIKIMGQPSDYNPEYTESTINESTTTSNYRRRLYRDPDNAAISGVCAGLAAYLNIDVALVRIIFVLLFFVGGATFLVYLILWIALPAAITTAQKLEMRGEDVTISNIEKAVKKEYNNVKDNIRRNKPGERFRDFIGEIFNIFGTVIRVIAKVFVFFIGFIMIIVGIALIVAFVGASAGFPWTINDAHFEISNVSFLLGQFISPAKASLLVVSTVLLTLIPLLAIIYLGLKLIFRFKTKDRYFLLGSLAAWILSIIVLVIIIVSTVVKMSNESYKTTRLDIKISSYSTLVLKADETNKVDKSMLIKVDDHKRYLIIDGKQIIGRPELVIEHTSDSIAYIEIERNARGISYEEAYENARQIIFNAAQSDSIIKVDSYFGMNNKKWRVQQVKMKLYLPKGTKLYVDKSLEEILSYVDGYDSYWPSELVGKQWQMGEEGLVKISK